MKLYLVVEQHYGDKQYWPGDTRELREDDAASLLALGLITETNKSKKSTSQADPLPTQRQATKSRKAEAKDQDEQPETENNGDLLANADENTMQEKGTVDGDA